MNIIHAVKDEQLFRPFLANGAGSVESWYPHFAALRCLYGIPQPTARLDLVRQCTGRDPLAMPATGFDSALFLTGRRSGKSRMAAVIGAYEAIFGGHEKKLAKGEKGIVAILAPTKPQGLVLKRYLRAVLETPMLRTQVVGETKEGFDLMNGNRIEILAGDFRTVRGYTNICVLVDEAAFFSTNDASKISDTELIAALEPGLSMTGGKLIAISSPFARRGWCWDTYQRNFGNEAGTTLVWQAPSRVMNPLLKQSVVDKAMAEDLARAKSEFFAEFRDDVSAFISRDVLEKLVVQGRKELMPEAGLRYLAFCDLSGGRGDDAALAICHKVGRTVVVDLVRTWKAPFSPHAIVQQIARELRRFGLSQISGDNFAASFNSESFRACGIRYIPSESPKSSLYLELLPVLCSGEIELLDNDLLVSQLASLERRTRPKPSR